MVLKWPFLNDIGKETLHIHCSSLLGGRASSQYDHLVGWPWKGCSPVTFGKPHFCTVIFSGLGKTDLQAILPRDRALSTYDSFSGKILKKPFLSDTGEYLAHLLRYWGGRTSSCSPCRQNFKPFSKKMQLQVDVIVLMENGTEKAISQWHCGRLCLFVYVSHEAELI